MRLQLLIQVLLVNSECVLPNSQGGELVGMTDEQKSEPPKVRDPQIKQQLE